MAHVQLNVDAYYDFLFYSIIGSKSYSFMPFFSYWNNLDKVDSIEHLNQMENSLKESINQIHLQKVWFLNTLLVLWLVITHLR